MTNNATLTVEQKAAVERLSRRPSEPREKTLKGDRHADNQAKWKGGRSERIAGTRKRWDDLDIKRGYPAETPAQVNLVNKRCAITLEDAKTFAILVGRKVFDSTCDVMADAIAKSLLPFVERIKSLEAQLEQRKYCGVWDQGTSYAEHNMVSFDGSVWFAKAKTISKPGSDLTWQLAVKKGRNGRDAERVVSS